MSLADPPSCTPRWLRLHSWLLLLAFLLAGTTLEARAGSGSGSGGHDDGGHDDGGHGDEGGDDDDDDDDDDHAGHGRKPDFVRLLSASDSPDPFDPRLAPLTLQTSSAVRESILPSGPPQSNKPRYTLGVCWEIFSGQSRIARFRIDQEIKPPYTIVELPLQQGGGRKRFVRLPSTLTWDGRTRTGQQAPPGPYRYRVIAELLKYTGNNSNPHEVDDSDPVEGTVSIVRPAVDPPTVSEVPALTRNPELALSGTKPANTSLLLAGNEVVALDASTTWSTTVTLVEGSNSFEIRARNQEGVQSNPVTVTTVLDSEPPPPPEVEPPPPISTSPTVQLSGTKEPGTAIYINGVEVVPANDETTWSFDLELEDGLHDLIVTSVDDAGNESTVSDAESAEVHVSKPVIGQLTVNPEVHVGGTATIRYKLFAEVPPVENAALLVVVRVLDGARIVRTLLDGTSQTGSTEGTSYEVTWDLLDSSGQPAAPNHSYTIQVLADRAAPTNEPPELANANPKTAPLLLIGSRRIRHDGGNLELIFRPDDLDLRVENLPHLDPDQSKNLQELSFTPIQGGYRISSDRQAEGTILCLWKVPGSVGAGARPARWRPGIGWQLIPDADWHPETSNLSFEMNTPGTFVLVTTRDIQPPIVQSVTSESNDLVVLVRDEGSAVEVNEVRCRIGNQDLTSAVTYEPTSTRGQTKIRIRGARNLSGPLGLYLQDQTGNSRHELRRGR